MSKQNCLLPRLILIACGSFSPTTLMHLRMFEIARNHLMERGAFKVIGGIMSPVHDAQRKQGLVAGVHRLAMLRLALRTSNWIRVSDWELQQPQWTSTVDVLKYHKDCINNVLKDKAEGKRNIVLPHWLPAEVTERTEEVHLKFLAGADLLETFADPQLWTNAEVEGMCSYGLVIVSRFGSEIEKFIFESDILSKYSRNIELVTNWSTNNMSSTYIRRLLKRDKSVKYLIDDDVIEYIRKYNLYNC
ncbi:nicotinamide/nicotinic acid mononucleotide adenylyltransferase 1-like [Zeugodacus cucurbitae]|uniref:nicotinamide/nicotinic acid mononucleotide adenylyltransferase 1-like n=1 Tax=Zeugodacus cucurbitae TaxID=28588 RepID=UPI0023D8EF49|nr:nicotinamide/nicotinic acid mononucleotide adenylyltransferase 1-like [Zeugodacus cucurbitae]